MIINEFDNTLSMVIGDVEELTATLSGDYTYTEGDSVTLSVKRNISDADELFESIGTVDSSGTAHIPILSEYTAGAVPGNYWYNIKLIMASTPMTIVPLSKFILIPEV